MDRRVPSVAVIAVSIMLAALTAAAPAGASSTYQLALGQGEAFSLLGHSCGGIQERTYATGFAGVHGLPAGDVHLQTSCGGSGRGGGYKTTTYSTWASVTWDWLGHVRSYSRLEGGASENPAFSAEDAYGDREYNSGTVAYLETTSPPLTSPAAPTGVTATLVVAVDPETPTPDQFQVSWTPAQETAPYITSSTITATPVNSTAPVLTTTVQNGGTSALVGPLERNVTYSITVTNGDDEGTSAPSAPIEATDAHPHEENDGGGGGGQPPEFGRCVKLSSASGAFATATCTTESTTGTGSYEWFPGVVAGGFTTSLKPATLVTFETTSKQKLTCTGESGSGSITGAQSVGGIVMTFSGCASAGGACTSPAQVSGVIVTSSLQGTVGIERITEKEGREVQHLAISYSAEGGGALLEYACGAGAEVAIEGAALAPAPSDHMAKTTALKFSQSAGKQKPQGFAGGPAEVLISSLGQQVGLSMSATKVGEEAVELNTVI